MSIAGKGRCNGRSDCRRSLSSDGRLRRRRSCRGGRSGSRGGSGRARRGRATRPLVARARRGILRRRWGGCSEGRQFVPVVFQVNDLIARAVLDEILRHAGPVAHQPKLFVQLFRQKLDGLGKVAVAGDQAQVVQLALAGELEDVRCNGHIDAGLHGHRRARVTGLAQEFAPGLRVPPHRASRYE